MPTKLGIVVGHTASSGGAQGIGIDQEYAFNKRMAADLRSYAISTYSTGAKAIEVEIFFRDNGGIPGAYGRADAWGADFTAELHYNSFSNTNVRGTETLSSGTSGSLAFANEVQASHCSILGRVGASRGVKIRNRSNQQRGWFSLVSGAAPAIITEPAFGSNASDASLLRNNQFELGRAIVDSVYRIL